MRENIAYISLGSNIEDRYEHLVGAVRRLGDMKQVEIVSQSSIYETDPVGYTEQAPFLNMVIKITTSFSPEELLNVTQEIEQTGGRTKTFRWGPRAIDLDILLFNNENIKLEHLQIPHPRMLERGFVLIPLKELEPNYIFNNGKTIASYIDQLDDKEGVHRWKSSYGEEGSELFEN
ncbi:MULTISPECIES: 2-amino-4-hydroxy-6-hydroxymethyldihydropteridine diphosphokinase [Bacillaceae]|uniref:2-amino-4-hydroxy-6-hydroxymethyldihydropteridine diphosphokinase n=1 Tax=Evansella alkalicola TaxID=745819 RepID=A0ABS6JWH1_9BACI|nr:2-amino-4-hydroxy-6-hydroxymethyldihydropteridine diphosphokinase [Litchfieldia alkalitelluris]MBU9722024.1 2-amino-4-hydroxy-6-hydroxymethyldihydropteridine diphosphokinase [Bacillus alkalicola]